MSLKSVFFFFIVFFSRVFAPRGTARRFVVIFRAVDFPRPASIALGLPASSRDDDSGDLLPPLPIGKCRLDFALSVLMRRPRKGKARRGGGGGRRRRRRRRWKRRQIRHAASSSSTPAARGRRERRQQQSLLFLSRIFSHKNASLFRAIFLPIVFSPRKL